MAVNMVIHYTSGNKTNVQCSLRDAMKVVLEFDRDPYGYDEVESIYVCDVEGAIITRQEFTMSGVYRYYESEVELA